MKTRSEQLQLAVQYFLNEKGLFGNLKLHGEESRSSVQHYILDMPSQYVYTERYIDNYKDNHTQTTITQELPDIGLFMEEFSNYFKGFELREFDKKNNTQIVKSFIATSDAIYYTTTSSKIGIKSKLTVQYYNNWKPYPIIDYDDITHKINKKTSENNKIKERTMKVKRMLHHNNNVFKTRERIYENKVENLNKLVRKYYRESNDKSECPVCYEIILPDNLFVSGCCHFICQLCSEKCNNCPLCRESYLR